MDKANERQDLFRRDDAPGICVVNGPGNEGCSAADKMTEPQANSDNIIVKQVQIINKMGLHARPAMQFVDLANKYNSHISVCKKTQCVNAKSIMELLLLAAGAGTVLTIKAQGDDAAQAVEALAKLVGEKFGED